jgi:GABA(A) receptor-associated protein
MNNFKDKSLEERIRIINVILRRYPDRVPIYVYPDKCIEHLRLDKEKFLVHNDITIADFIYIIRKRIKLEPEKALFLTFNNNVVSSNTLLYDVYEKYKDKDDKMLYCIYTLENTFG